MLLYTDRKLCCQSTKSFTITAHAHIKFANISEIAYTSQSNNNIVYVIKLQFEQSNCIRVPLSIVFTYYIHICMYYVRIYKYVYTYMYVLYTYI